MEQPGYYSILTADVRYDSSISDFAKLLYSDITALCNKAGYCSAANEYFVRVFGKSRRTIIASITALADAGYLRVEVIRDDKNTVVGRKLWPQTTGKNAEENAGEEPQTPGAENCTTSCENLHDPSAENCTYIKENNTSINNTPIAPRGEGELFDEFWAAYPKHVAKQPARKAWAKLKADADLLAKILAALEWQKREESWRRDDGRYIPNPATWLNARRWEDEPGAEAKPGKEGGGRKWLK